MYAGLLEAGVAYGALPGVLVLIGTFRGMLVAGIWMLASDVTSCTSMRIRVFPRIIWLCSCIACCLITGRRPDRTSWVAPGVRVVHGHGGGLTTIGASAGVAVGRVVEDDSPRSHSLLSRLGFSFPPLTMCLVVRLAFQDLYCK